MARPKTYVRPMTGWWRGNPYFVRYMVREASSVFLATYAIVLLVGLAPAAHGANPWPNRQANRPATASRQEWSALRHCDRKTQTVTAGV